MARAHPRCFISFIELTDGPMVLEVPPRTLSVLDDMWFRWVGDVGVPGPDRGEGGRYLIVPRGYRGPLPEGGYYAYRSATSLGRVPISKKSTTHWGSPLKMKPRDPSSIV